MEHSHSKRSCLTSSKKFDQMLSRGHNSEITDVKSREAHHPAIHPSRRMFTFKGSHGKRATSHNTSKQRSGMSNGHSPASSRNTSMMRGVIGATDTDSAWARRARSISRMRTPVRLHSRSRSTVRQIASQKPSSRAASAAGSQPASRKASSNARPMEPPPPPPPQIPATVASGTAPTIASHQHDIQELLNAPLSPPGFIKIEESKLMSSLPKSSDSEDGADDVDEQELLDQQPNVTIEIPTSPSLITYRKVMYNEVDNKWVEHWKVVEDLKRALERKKREAQLVKMNVIKPLPPPHKVKGRSTARMQVMFPTAIVKHDRRHGFVHTINMTDALRLELHKRKAPIVPTFYQEHILRFGKLPFRNNPRPHPVV